MDYSHHIRVGNDYFDKGKFDEAIGEYNEVLDDLNYFYAIYNKSLSLRNLIKYEEALTWFDKALAINPLDVAAMRGKGVTLFYLSKYEEALTCYDKALSINPNDVRTLNHKGNLFYTLKKYDGAVEYYNKALAIDRYNVDAVDGIKRIDDMKT